MKKSYLIIILGVIALVIGVVVFKNTTSKPQDSSINTSQSQSNTTTAKQQSAADPVSNNAYQDYSEDAYNNAKGERVLFFYASWCPKCRALDEDIKSKGVPAGATILKVDFDDSQALRQKYGVTIQTTVVRVDSNGNLVKKAVLYDKPTVAELQEQVL